MDQEDGHEILTKSEKVTRRPPDGTTKYLVTTHLTTMVCGCLLCISGGITAGFSFGSITNTLVATAFAVSIVFLVVALILVFEYVLIAKKYNWRTLSRRKVGVVGLVFGSALTVTMVANTVVSGSLLLRESVLLQQQPVGPISSRDISQYMDKRLLRLTDVQVPPNFPYQGTIGEKFEAEGPWKIRVCIAPISEIPLNAYIGCVSSFYDKFKRAAKNCEEAIEKGYGCFKNMQQANLNNGSVLAYRVPEGMEQFSMLVQAANKFELEDAVLLELIEESNLPEKIRTTAQAGQKQTINSAITSWALCLLPLQLVLLALDCFAIFKLGMLNTPSL